MSTRRVGHVQGMTLAILTAAALFATAPRVAAADHTNVHGAIIVRGDSTFTIMQDNTVPVLIQVTDATKVGSLTNKGTAADLVVGLRVRVSGAFNDQGRFVAKRITFTDADQKVALAIKAGLVPTNQRVEQNAANIIKDEVALQHHDQVLTEHAQTLQGQRNDIDANHRKMLGTTGAITERINTLDDFNVVDRYIVYFKNGRANVAPEYVAGLAEFAAKAKGFEGYRLQVQGYASAVGRRDLNEALSVKRTDAVMSVLLQHAGVPQSNFFMPAPMGISEQFAENTTAKGQAENRRVTVTILQNRAFAK